ncbi:MAG: HNH endonuclease [Planctomycetota bacterium]
MTDQDILDRINAGTLTVLVNVPSVWSPSTRGWVRMSIITHQSHGSTYRFVSICHKGKKKKIALHRLVWMFANRSLVPEGYDVDHREADKRDTIDNLRLLESSKNRRRGKPKEQQEEELPF